MAQVAADGARVRILLGDPDDPHVDRRGEEEGIDLAMAAKVRNALVLYRPLLRVPGVELRLHGTVLYSSIFRTDDQVLINPHVYGLAAAHAPVLHLRRQTDGGLVSTYLDGFERVWGAARVVVGE